MLELIIEFFKSPQMDECYSLHARWSQGPWERRYISGGPGGVLETTPRAAGMHCWQRGGNLMGLLCL